MKKYSHTYWFVTGLFMASALVPNHILAGICVVFLLVLWGEYRIPVAVAVLLDSTFAVLGVVQYFVGVYTLSVLLLAGILLTLRKHLQV